MAEEPSLYKLLRSAILNGRYRPGDVLVETAVADAFGVSRTPVREAFSRLEQDGILQRKGRRLVVYKPTPQEVLEIYDCLTVLEGMAAQWAATMRNDYDLAVMQRALDEMITLEDKTPAKMAATGHAFHVSVWQASHNATLRDLLARLMVHLGRYPGPTVSQPGRWDEAIQEHRTILAAIEARDGATAQEATMAHTTSARKLRLDMIARDGGRSTAARSRA